MLVGEQGATEGHPLLQVLNRSLERQFGGADHLVGRDHAFVLELGHLLLEPATGLPDGVRHRHPAVVEGQLCGVGAAHTQLVELATDREPGGVGRDDDLRHTPVAALVGGPGEQAQPVRLGTAGDPHLGAVDDPFVAILHRPRTDPRHVGSGIGLRDRNGGHHLACDRGSQVLLPQLIAAVPVQRGGGHVGLHRDRHCHAERCATAQLLAEDHLVGGVGPATAPPLVVGESEQAQLAHLGEQFPCGKAPGFLPRIGVGVDLLAHELPDSVPEHLVVLGELQHRRSWWVGGCSNSGCSKQR